MTTFLAVYLTGWLVMACACVEFLRIDTRERNRALLVFSACVLALAWPGLCVAFVVRFKRGADD